MAEVQGRGEKGDEMFRIALPTACMVSYCVLANAAAGVQEPCCSNALSSTGCKECIFMEMMTRHSRNTSKFLGYRLLYCSVIAYDDERRLHYTPNSDSVLFPPRVFI